MRLNQPKNNALQCKIGFIQGDFFKTIILENLLLASTDGQGSLKSDKYLTCHV